ncbi:hypothetical protein SASPL_117283 [Salvia splendens]|uniref:Alpha-L-fucosidase n=1 Tax=Salvia splendens TaxID=180675 RepID=A0A8X8XVH0_SALSN|nr:hypothetical protein SASPL_117283 [Salvia splendens]
MAISSTLKKLVFTFLLLQISSLSHAHLLKTCKIDQIYNIGDSISDTGNLIREIGLATFCARPPYGESFFKKPTGRCSNGLLMIDFMALDAGVPLLPPYKNSGADFRHGVNFAVAGSTALPCKKMENAVFMFGTIGGNDYNYAFFEGKPIEEVRSMVPQVVNTIMLGVKKVMSYGATKVVVPGNMPIGCLPVYKTQFLTNISAAYDESLCLKQMNDFAKYHNQQLQQAIHDLQQQNPNATVVYADYYNAYQFLLEHSKSHGFETERACCGIGGKYNYDMPRMCGNDGVGVCPDPERYVSWDGVHLTQRSYKIMAGWLLRQIFSSLHCHF